MIGLTIIVKAKKKRGFLLTHTEGIVVRKLTEGKNSQELSTLESEMKLR